MKTFTKFFLFAFSANLIIGSTVNAQITQRGSATTGTTTSATLTINKPTGLSVGDVMIANIVQGDNDNDNLSNATAAGWIFVKGGELGTDGDDSWWGTVLYKVADAADVAAASFAFTLDSDANGDGSVGGIVAFFNVLATGGVGPNGTGTGPFDVAAGTFQVTGSSNNATITAPSITTATTNAAVIMLGMAGNNITFSGWSTTSPGTLTQAFEINSNSNPDEAAAGAWALKSTAGVTGNGTATMSGSNRNGGLLIALRGTAATPTVTLSPSTTQYILVGGSVNFTATALNYTGTGNYTYTWNSAGGVVGGANPNTIAASSDTKSITYAAPGTYTVNVTIARSGSATLTTNSTTVIVSAVPAAANMWATSSNGTQVSTYTVVNGIYINGPINLFAPTFPGTTTGGTTTAALGKNAPGFYYWLPNTSGNAGVVEVFAATASGTTHTRIGSFDVNGGSTNSLGFVRLGMGPDGTGWILAGDNTNLYLAKFMSNGVNLVTISTVPVVLTGGAVSTFQNGDVCIAGDNTMYALANNGSGVTQIFRGSLNGATVTLAKRWDLVDPNNAPFTGSVNGVAFDAPGSLYISTATGLFFINQATVNGPAGTVECDLVNSVTGLQDLASNFFPTGSTLPVSLVSFLGSYLNQKTTLIWETENITNFRHFEIQRSTNGSSYSTIGYKNQQGDGMSRTQYQYMDDLTSNNAAVFYYRLKMVDIDGNFKYSNMIVIRKIQKGADLVVNPNPIINGSRATANFTSSQSSKVTFNIIDMTGKVVLTQQNNVLQGTNTVTINNLDRLQSGMYIVRMNDGESSSSSRIYIAH